MKIIQIMSDVEGDSSEMRSTLYGLSDDGKLYYWGIERDGDVIKSGWKLLEDDFNN